MKIDRFCKKHNIKYRLSVSDDCLSCCFIKIPLFEVAFGDEGSAKQMEKPVNFIQMEIELLKKLLPNS